MNRICPITLEWIEQAHPHPFHPNGLRKLSPHLTQLHALPHTHESLQSLAIEQRKQQNLGETHTSVAMRLEVQRGCFAPDVQRGRYWITPQDPGCERMPENEALTLHLARMAGIDTVVSGLIDTADPNHGFALWTRRVDRIGQATQLPLVPFAKLLPPDTEATTEAMVSIIDTHTTFPARERAAFFQTVLFNFLVGNSGMLADQWHLLTDARGIKRLAPRLALRNTQLTEPGAFESSLPLGGNGTRVDKSMLLKYLGKELLRLPDSFLRKRVDGLLRHGTAWKLALERSYLLPRQKFDYQLILNERANRLR